MQTPKISNFRPSNAAPLQSAARGGHSPFPPSQNQQWQSSERIERTSATGITMQKKASLSNGKI